MTCATATVTTMLWLTVFVACTAIWSVATGLTVLAAMIIAHCLLDELMGGRQ